MFDFALVTGTAHEIISVVWNNETAEKKHRRHPRLKKGGCVRDWLQVVAEGNGDCLILDEVEYSVRQLVLPSDLMVYLFSARCDRQQLFAQVLEEMAEGIQIYDQNGYLLFCNRMSRRISTIPDEMPILGKHMLDIWNVKEESSAALSCIKAKAPVINRVDTFPSISIGEVTTVNTAYPLIDKGEVRGAVLFERDIATIQNKKKENDITLKALQSFTHNNSSVEHPGYTFDLIIGRSAALRTAVELAQKFARVDCHILLIGKTGTGKEMFAQSIHRESQRGHNNFVALNCAAFPDTLIESLLFGTAKGAFTGSENKAGLFEESDGGTLFLDELNSMSLMMQSKILRTVQEGVCRRIGGSRDIKVNVRIISASNEDPLRLVETGKMRRDLFYRLSSVQVQIPPLSERIEDLEPLIERYIQVKKHQFAKTIDYVAPEVLSLFREYDWPGNVRELFHVLDYAMNIMEGGVLDVACLPTYLTKKTAAGPAKLPGNGDIDLFNSKLTDIMGDYEAGVLAQVLEHHGYNISRAAKSLGICRQSLSYRLRKYGLVV